MLVFFRCGGVIYYFNPFCGDSSFVVENSFRERLQKKKHGVFSQPETKKNNSPIGPQMIVVSS